MKCKIVTLGSVLFLLVSFFTPAQLTPVAPKRYSATARIDVTKRDVQIDCDAPCDHCSLRFSASLATVEYLIVSPPRLHEVARRLNLAEKWTKNGKVLSPERVHQILKNSLRTRQYGETSIIAITAQRPDASEATEIANEVAREFQRYAEEEGVKEKERAKKALEKELQKQKDKTDTAEQQVSELRKKLGLPAKARLIEDPEIRKRAKEQLQKERHPIRVSWLTADAKAKQLANPENMPLLEFASRINDLSVRKMASEVREMTRELNTAKSKFEPNHPKINEKQAAVNELTEKLKNACADVRKGAEAICAIEKNKLDAIEKEIEAISSHVQNPELRKAQCKHEIQKSILDALELRTKVLIATFRPTLSVEIIRLSSE